MKPVEFDYNVMTRQAHPQCITLSTLWSFIVKCWVVCIYFRSFLYYCTKLEWYINTHSQLF